MLLYKVYSIHTGLLIAQFLAIFIYSYYICPTVVLIVDTSVQCGGGTCSVQKHFATINHFSRKITLASENRFQHGLQYSIANVHICSTIVAADGLSRWLIYA